MSPMLLVATLICAIGLLAVALGVVAMLRARPLAFTVRTLSGMLLIALGVILGAISVGVQGYQALVHEQVAARVVVQPLGSRRFEAIFRFPDGRSRTFVLAGDEIYVDAHILKWKPLASIVGLHTMYELNRVAGRYRDIEEERNAERTVHSLETQRSIDLFDLRQRFARLAPFFDAEYGSGVFVPVGGPAELELRVSTSGLMIRESGRPRASD